MTTINRMGKAVELDRKNYLDELKLHDGKEKETLLDYLEHIITDKTYVYFNDEEEVIITGDDISGVGINVKVNDEYQSTKTVSINGISDARKIIDLAFDGDRDILTILGIIVEYSNREGTTSIDYVTVIQS